MSHSPLLNLPGPSRELLDEIESALTQARDFVAALRPRAGRHLLAGSLQRVLLQADAAVLHRHLGGRSRGLRHPGGAAQRACRRRNRLRQCRSRIRNRRRDLGQHGGGSRHRPTAAEAVRGRGVASGDPDLHQLGRHAAGATAPGAGAGRRGRSTPGDVGPAGPDHRIRWAIPRSSRTDPGHRRPGCVGPNRARQPDDTRAASRPAGGRDGRRARVRRGRVVRCARSIPTGITPFSSCSTPTGSPTSTRGRTRGSRTRRATRRTKSARGWPHSRPSPRTAATRRSSGSTGRRPT